MNKNRTKKIITIFTIMLSVLVLAGISIIQKDKYNEKEIVTASALWPSFSFETAANQASTIVYGKVVEKVIQRCIRQQLQLEIYIQNIIRKCLLRLLIF